MALAPGARLGPYEIIGPLGSGGMGDVYRARDSRLNRTVAIKVLPDHAAADPDRRERFEREAKAISALDHPNICALYDVGEHDGVYFLVMPCLEGQTLADRLVKGPVPPDQAMRIAIEMATALDAAHRHGIIHRDLKPGNVMLTKAGVKLLDFGLAKLKPVAGPLTYSGMMARGAAETTNVAPGTGAGTLLGTMPYMAPEQVEGRDVDARSDIFSLGAVIYEMVTGQRAFKGDSPASVIGAILKDEPPPMKTLQPLAPAALDHVVTTCLAKDPDERWQSAADIARELKWIASSTSGDIAPDVRFSGGWRERAGWIMVTTVLLAALGSIWLRPGPATREIARLAVNPPAGTVFTALGSATVPTPQFAVSPDGRALAFVASAGELDSTLWLRALDDVDARLLPGTEGAQEPFWSPDGQSIGFFDQSGSMKRVPVSGGNVRTIATGISDPRGAAWGIDDEILLGTGYGGIYLVSAAGGLTPQPLTQLDRSKGEGSHRWPQFLPDGQHFLFTVRSGLTDQRGVYAASRDGKTKRLVLGTNGDMQFVGPDTVLFLDGDTLLSQRLDLESLQLSGVTTPVAANVGRSSRGNGAFSASSAGTLAYAVSTVRPSRLTWFDRTGDPLGVVGPDGAHDYVDFRLSPDEKLLALSLVDPKTSLADLWMTDLVRGGTTRLTFGPQLNSAPVWSPGGDRIAFRSSRSGTTEIYEKSAGAGGGDQTLMSEDLARRSGMGASNLITTDWSSDGKHLAVATNTPSDIWLVSVAGNSPPMRLVRSVGDQMHANFSPDRRFIAYTSNESGQRHDVYVETLPSSDRKWSISVEGGYEPRWRADGKEIYYLARDGTLMAVPMATGAAPFGVPKPLFQTRVHGGVSILRTHFVPNRDGSRFLVSVRSSEPVPVPITVVLNWPSLLKR